MDIDAKFFVAKAESQHFGAVACGFGGMSLLGIDRFVWHVVLTVLRGVQVRPAGR
jgi:hypothetical protein